MKISTNSRLAGKKSNWIDFNAGVLVEDKTMAEESGVCASQIMLLSGTDESGLENPNWRSNLALALYLQEAVSRRHGTLMRPVNLVPQRYNLHLTRGSLIMEVGSSGIRFRKRWPRYGYSRTPPPPPCWSWWNRGAVF